MLAHGLAPAAYGLMVLAYPSGFAARPPANACWSRSQRSSVSSGWALRCCSSGPARAPTCAPRVSSLLYTGHTFDYLVWAQASWVAFIVVGVCFVALLVRRLRAAPRGARVTLLPLGLAVFFTAAEFVAQRVVSLGGWQSPGTALDWVDRLNALVLPLAIFAGLAAIRRRRGPLGDLVVELDRARRVRWAARWRERSATRRSSSRSGCPERSGSSTRWESRSTRARSPGRALTTIGPAGGALAALIHDERLLGQRSLLEAAGSAARLALENTRLQAELRAQLAELRASRARIVGAADAERRRRLERDLHDGAQQRLLALGLALQLLRDGDGDQELLAQAEAELQTALRELRDLARGIHPTILSEQGLGAAVRSLADRAAVPVQVEAVDERYPASVETTAYFVVAEALANIAKHAHARLRQVRVAPREREALGGRQR